MIQHRTCPTCGSKKIRRVRRTIVRTSRGREFKVPNLSFYECPDCGEQVYSPEAMQKIEACRAQHDGAAA